MPMKQDTLGKSGYELLKPGVVRPVAKQPPFLLDFPLTTKYGYEPPWPVQKAIFDFLAALTPGIKFFMSSHLSYKFQFVPICLLFKTLKVAHRSPWTSTAVNY